MEGAVRTASRCRRLAARGVGCGAPEQARGRSGFTEWGGSDPQRVAFGVHSGSAAPESSAGDASCPCSLPRAVGCGPAMSSRSSRRIAAHGGVVPTVLQAVAGRYQGRVPGGTLQPPAAQSRRRLCRAMAFGGIGPRRRRAHALRGNRVERGITQLQKGRALARHQGREAFAGHVDVRPGGLEFPHRLWRHEQAQRDGFPRTSWAHGRRGSAEVAAKLACHTRP